MSALLGFFTGINPKIHLFLIIVGAVCSIGFFGWRYIDNLNEEKIELAIQVKDEQAAKQIVKETLYLKSAESEQRKKAVEIYSGVIADAMSELDRIDKEKAALKGKVNELRFSENFEEWSRNDIDHFNECLSNGFDRLLDNLSEATANRLQNYEIKMPCTALTRRNSQNKGEAASDAGQTW